MPSLKQVIPRTLVLLGSTTTFHDDGYAVIPGFLSAAEVQKLKDATKSVVSKYCEEMPTSIFSAKSEGSRADEGRDTYFAESGDKIRGFFEETAVNEGKLIFNEKEKALNKIGHALHKFEQPFEEITFSSKVKEVTSKLSNISRPTVIQSMVIFKHPKIGGEVKAHQDASYLFTEPTSGSLLGLWIALDDANIENGCLHFIPGSHKSGTLYQRFIRNPDKASDKLFITTGSNVIAPQDQFKAAPVHTGDLVLIDGLVIHQSESNNSDKPRLAYTFHIVDGSASYSKENWLQPTAAETFVEFQM